MGQNPPTTEKYESAAVFNDDDFLIDEDVVDLRSFFSLSKLTDGLYNRVRTTDFPLFLIENEEPTLLSQNPSENDKDESVAVFDDDDDFLIDEDVVDFRSFSPVGPITNIELLKLPLQPKQINRWIIQQSKYYRFSIIFH